MRSFVSGALSRHQSAYLKGAVDSCASVKNPQHLPGLATHMERQRKIQEVVEGELRHSWCEKSGAWLDKG